jgi:hypothetical protein
VRKRYSTDYNLFMFSQFCLQIGAAIELTVVRVLFNNYGGYCINVFRGKFDRYIWGKFDTVSNLPQHYHITLSWQFHS